MIKRKYALAIVLVFCLTTALFIVASTGYDPWVDQDEDGDVDASDLNVLSQEYGTTGDPTKNVSVTNWPEPQKPTFAEILVLRGYVQKVRCANSGTEYEFLGVLVDENMPNLPHDFIINSSDLYYSDDVPMGPDKQADVNFTYVPANSPFFIQGEATIIPTVSYYFASAAIDVVYCDIWVHLEKVNPEGTAILSSDIIRFMILVNGIVNGTWEDIGVILDIPSPVVVNPNERLQIRFETLVRCDYGFVYNAHIELYHHLGTDEFIAYIPILQP